MNPNPYLDVFPQSEVEEVIISGSIVSDIDESYNLILGKTSTSVSGSSVSILLQNVPFDSVKVETKYNVDFTEL